jgi:chromosome segregation ATPase
MKVEVEWLRMRLAEVDDARDILKQFAILKEKTDDNRKLIEDAKSELVECEEQKKEVLEKLEAIRDKETACKQRLASATDDSTKIYRTVRFAKSKVGRFLYSSVMDGLI